MPNARLLNISTTRPGILPQGVSSGGTVDFSNTNTSYAPGQSGTNVASQTAHTTDGAQQLAGNMAASTDPSLQQTDNEGLLAGNVTTAGIVGPDPSLYNTFNNPWQAGIFGQYQQQANNVGTIMNADGSSAIPAAQASLGSQALTDARAGQTSLAQMLATQAAGGGTSAADLQMQRGIQQSILAQQAGAAATGGNGTNPFLLQRQLAMQAANTQQQGVNQAAILRAQETQAAQQALGSVYSDQAGSALQQNAAAAQLAQGNYQYALNSQQNAATNYAQAQQALASQIQAARAGTASNVATASLANANNANATTNAVIGAAGNIAGGLLGSFGPKAGSSKMDAGRAQLLSAAQQRVAPNAI